MTGFISDREFQMSSDQVSAFCDDPERVIRIYRQGQRFTSLWLVP